MKLNAYYTIQKADVNKPSLSIFGRTWLTSGWIGRIQPRDVGKRVYLNVDILQVENDEQRIARAVLAGKPRTA